MPGLEASLNGIGEEMKERYGRACRKDAIKRRGDVERMHTDPGGFGQGNLRTLQTKG